MKVINRSVYHVVRAAEGSPLVAVTIVMLFAIMFNALCATVEKLIFGERILDWLDPLFIIFFMAYSGLCVVYCGYYNSVRESCTEEDSNELK